jgi:hypothetical protein
MASGSMSRVEELVAKLHESRHGDGDCWHFVEGRPLVCHLENSIREGVRAGLELAAEVVHAQRPVPLSNTDDALVDMGLSRAEAAIRALAQEVKP